MPQRVPLAPISANRRPGTELSDEAKGKLCGRRAAGQSIGEIATAEGLSKSTVQDCLQRVTKRSTIKNKPRAGRPLKYSERDARCIIRIARKHPKYTYLQLRTTSGLDLSNDTIRSILKAYGIINWRCKKRPALTEEIARLRLQWARTHRNTDWSEWLFSDECSVEKGQGKETQWAFGYPHEKWTKERVEPYPKGKQGSVMIWCMIGATLDDTELIVMERDPATLRGGYTARSYTDTLFEGLLPLYNAQVFQQDNAPIHTAHHTRD